MNDQVPMIFTHMGTVYNELASRSERLDKGDILKFEGSKVEAFRATGISQGYYTEVFDSLTEMGCIEQIRRGAGHQATVIYLHHEPEYDQYMSIYTKRLTKRSPLDTIQQRISDMEGRMPGIDLDGFILSLDLRLAEIEARLDKIESSG